MKIRLLLFALIPTLILASCRNNDCTTIEFDQVEFNKQKALWDANGLQNYSFDVSYFSSATGPVEETVTVTNDVGDKGEEWFTKPISGIYETIEHSFDNMKENVAGNEDSNVAGMTLKIKYNKDFNYPEEIKYSVDYYEPVDGGGGYTLTISNFDVIYMEE